MTKIAEIFTLKTGITFNHGILWVVF